MQVKACKEKRLKYNLCCTLVSLTLPCESLILVTCKICIDYIFAMNKQGLE